VPSVALAFHGDPHVVLARLDVVEGEDVHHVVVSGVICTGCFCAPLTATVTLASAFFLPR
jgi:hypothetical protein